MLPVIVLTTSNKEHDGVSSYSMDAVRSKSGFERPSGKSDHEVHSRSSSPGRLVTVDNSCQ